MSYQNSLVIFRYFFQFKPEFTKCPLLNDYTTATLDQDRARCFTSLLEKNAASQRAMRLWEVKLENHKAIKS